MFIETIDNQLISFRSILTVFNRDHHLCCLLTNGDVHKLHYVGEDHDYNVLENFKRILNARKLNETYYSQSDMQRDMNHRYGK